MSARINKVQGELQTGKIEVAPQDVYDVRFSSK